MTAFGEEIFFSCTGCGNCCRDHYLPLTLEEAVPWLENKGTPIGLLVEIAPESEFLTDVTERSLKDFWQERMFMAVSGRANVLVNLELVSVIEGDCAHLVENTCTRYEERPSVCRVHPADITMPPDFSTLSCSDKKCPPEAWSGDLFMKGVVVERESERRTLLAFQRQQLLERALLRHIADVLSIRTGALRSEGSLIYPIETRNFGILIQECKRRDHHKLSYDVQPWRVYANADTARKRLRSSGVLTITDTMLRADSLFVVP